MGRLLLVVLIIVVIVVLWRAFGPSTRKKQINKPAQRSIVAPDDDPEFLWKLEKQARERRKAQREANDDGAVERRDKQIDDEHGDVDKQGDK